MNLAILEGLWDKKRLASRDLGFRDERKTRQKLGFFGFRDERKTRQRLGFFEFFWVTMNKKKTNRQGLALRFLEEILRESSYVGLEQNERKNF